MDNQLHAQGVKRVKCEKCNQIIEYGLPSCPYCGVKFIYPSRPAPTAPVTAMPKRERTIKNGLSDKKTRWYDLLPRLAIMLFACILLLSLFLPYIALTKDLSSLLKKMGSYNKMRYLSLLEHAILVNGELVDMDGGGIYVFFVISAALLAVWILVCGLFSDRPWARYGALIGNSWFLIIFCIQNWDFKDREIVPDFYRWGVSFYLILISLIFVYLLAFWQIFSRTVICEKYLRRLKGEKCNVTNTGCLESWEVQHSNDSQSAQFVNDNIQTSKRTVEVSHLQAKSQDGVTSCFVEPLTVRQENVDCQATKNNSDNSRRQPPKDEEDITMMRIRQYKKMLDEGFITEEEYQAKKRKLLDI